MQREAAVFPTARSLALLLTWQCHKEAQPEIYLNIAGLGVEGRPNDTSFPLPHQVRETHEHFTTPTCKQEMARGSINQTLLRIISYRYDTG